MSIQSSHVPTSNLRTAWLGRMAMDMGWGWFQGSIGDNHPHAHHALQIVVADEPISVWTREAEWSSHHGFIIGSNQMHQLATYSSKAMLIYVEPDSYAGRIIQQRMADRSLAVLQKTERQRLKFLTTVLATEAFNACIKSSFSMRVHRQTPQASDELISYAVQTIQGRTDGDLQAQELARQAGLSLSRFQHRFKQHTGMAIRPFLRWRRLLLAMNHMQAGHSMSDAAYAAGFADAAHMSRTMRRHFGISPKNVAALLAA